jgi:DNA-binding response OmpR family regulator
VQFAGIRLVTNEQRGIFYDCVSVESIGLAFQFAMRETFDLYLLELWCEDGSGIQLCKTIRELDPNVPIVFFSAWALTSARAEAIDAGANAYIFKPELDHLRRGIARRLKRVFEPKGTTTISSVRLHSVA